MKVGGNSLITNTILSICTNLTINLNDLCKCYGGIYSNSLAAARKICMIGDERFTFLFFSTGQILLSNFHPDCNRNNLFSYIISWCVDMVNKQIATIALEKCISFKFLIQNFSFAVFIDYSNSNVLYSSLLFKGHEKINKIIRNIFFDQSLANRFVDEIKKLDNCIKVKQSYDSKKENKRFPAIIFKIEFYRDETVFDFKSTASKKRKLVRENMRENNKRSKDLEKVRKSFQIQKISLTTFSNGKLNITGCQRIKDFVNIAEVLKVIGEMFLD